MQKKVIQYKKNIKDYAQLIKDRINHVQIEEYPNYQLFENGKIWSWKQLCWAKPVMINEKDEYYNLINQSQNKHVTFRLATLMFEYFHKIINSDQNELRHETIKEFPDYEIYQNGKIWSKRFSKFIKPRIQGGHQIVWLSKKDNPKAKKAKHYGRFVHDLLYEHFINPIPAGYVIHHLDFCKTNNDLNNLILMTAEAHLWFHAQMSRGKKKPRKNKKN